MARVTLAGAPAEHLAGGAAAGAALAAARQGLMLALAAECVGLAGRALEMTVGYVATRRQFGRPIGSFQAVKHRCAEMLVRLEAAWSALYLATSGLGDGPDPVLPVAGGLAAARLSAARICTGEAAFEIANEAIHLHGGIGFTWDYPLHLYYRRAKSNQQLLDSSGGQRIELATRVAALYAEQEQAS
jgi:alkylation response protein AidB-like acyl-CoA dehydrogenase